MNIETIYEKMYIACEKENIFATVTEIHGLMTGLLCGGLSADQNYIDYIEDVFNEKTAFSPPFLTALADMYTYTLYHIAEPNTQFTPLLSPKNAPLTDRLEKLREWIQCFLAGISFLQQNIDNVSKEVKESIIDLSELTKLDSNVEANKENEEHFNILIEHIRCSIWIFLKAFRNFKIQKKPTH